MLGGNNYPTRGTVPTPSPTIYPRLVAELPLVIPSLKFIIPIIFLLWRDDNVLFLFFHKHYY